MKSALHVTFAPIAKAATLVAALACIPSAAIAGYVVNTGQPLPDTESHIWGFGEVGFAGSFELASAQTLTAVDIWFYIYQAGDVTVSLWSGLPTVGGTPLFTTTSSLGITPLLPFQDRWETFGGLNWPVAPGAYSVTFFGGPGINGVLNTGAPSPLSDYYLFAAKDDGTGNAWFRLPDDDGHTHTFGIRISAIPEPETYGLMLAGLSIVGVALRRRQARGVARTVVEAERA